MCGRGLELPALAFSRFDRRHGSRDRCSFLGPQRLKRDHDLDSPDAGPLAAGHDGPPGPNTARSFTYFLAALILSHCSRLLVWVRSIAMADLRGPCASGSAAWRDVYRRAFGRNFLVGGVPGTRPTLVEHDNLGVLSHGCLFSPSSIGAT
jgi:hypothetical protein